jgi:hypothetical protein
MPDGAERANPRAEKLGRAVRTRLAELGVSGRTLAEAGYIPRGNLQRLTSGVSVPRDLTGLDRGLGWQPGSAEMAAAGGEPKAALATRAGAPTGVGQVLLDWPRSDEDWRAAVEDAWERYEHPPTTQGDGAGHAVGPADPQVSGWLAPRVEGLPVWLAERVRTVLTEASVHPTGTLDPLVLADRIIPLDHAREVLALLIDWCRTNDRGGPGR